MNLADVMDELAARIDTIDGLRVHAFPPHSVQPPAAVVTYPETYSYDETYGRGSDRLTIPVVVLVGRVSDRASRDNLAVYADGSGAQSIKAVLENDLPAGGLDLPGVAGSYASTPDHASLDITGDIDLRVELIDLTPSNLNRTYLSKWSTAPNLSYLMRGTLFGTLDMIWSTNGSNSVSEFNFRNNSICYRATLDVNNGAGGKVVTLEYGTNIEGPFTVMETATLTGTTSIFAGNAALILGAHNGGNTDPMTGRITRARVYAGLDESDLRADPDFRFHAEGTTSFVDSTGKTWTVHGDANIAEGQQFAYTAFDTARVMSAEFDVVSVAGVEHVAATFQVDVFGNGAA